MENQIKTYRRRCGITQQQLANLVGISREHLIRIEKQEFQCNIYIALKIYYVLYELHESFELHFASIFHLSGREQNQLDKSIAELRADLDCWSPDVPLDDYDS